MEIEAVSDGKKVFRRGNRWFVSQLFKNEHRKNTVVACFQQ
jgi:hypothetical protein